ncbi:helix-turn-helix transcriptional regulator [Halosimplex amylolyticum]|uniref:helix-turn-helix transcriptional regulator n=1 Tax=Halosimplex amylolyticum TaxID=3396616 RepID=UPI003F55CBC5
MSPRSSVAVVTALLLLAGVAPVAALAGAPSGSNGGAAAAANALPHNSTLDPGEVEMRVDVAANGDAQWRVKTVLPVGDGDREAFDDLVDEFNESESPLGVDGFRAAAANASEATGRSMEIRNVERHHALHNETGGLWITFTWTNFGRTNGDRLFIGDVFNGSSGMLLPGLTADETLVIVPPEGYGVSSAPTGTSSAPSSLSNGVARWEGPQDFGDRGPWIVYSGDAPTPTRTPTTVPPNGTASPTAGGPGTGPGTSPGGPGSDGDGLLSGALPLVVLIVLAAASAAVLAAYMRGDDDGFDGIGALVGSGGTDGGSSASAGSDGAPDHDAGVEVDAASGSSAVAENGSGAADTASAGASAAGAGAAAAADESVDGDDEDDEIDEELLSDEERVERLIEQNGGRMKQAAIVQETGWSNAKVSQLLSSMDDDGRIDKLRIGRENLISFPDEDVADLDSE